MPRWRFPDLDAQSFSEELEGVSEVASITTVQGGLQIDLEEKSLIVSCPVDAQKQAETVDDILFLTADGYVRFNTGGPRQHKFSNSRDFATLLRRIIKGDSEGEKLGTEEALDLLTEAEYLSGTTPEQLRKLMIGWAVSNGNDRVLDVATGSGLILRQAAKQNDSSELVGVENNPSLARLANSILCEVESADVVNTDFFDWGMPDRNLSESNENGDEPEKFDVVVGNPPVMSLSMVDRRRNERIQPWVPGEARSVGSAFVSKAVSHLKDGGRGAFLLPKSSLKSGLLEELAEACAVHRIVELPRMSTHTAHSPQLVLLTVVKETKSDEVRDTGIARFNQMQLPENVRGLFEQPLDKILQNRYNPYNAEVVRASHADLEGKNVVRILSNPSMYDIVTSDGFTEFGDLSGVRAGSGLTTGNNDFFYLSEEEKCASDIDPKFFTPVIKNPSNDDRTITREEIDLYLLDLEKYIAEIEVDSQRSEAVESEIIDKLREDGHDELVEYIEQEPFRLNRNSPSFEVKYRGVFENPDLVISKFFDDPRCYKVDIDDNVLFDTTVIGIQTTDDGIRDSLARLLNTPLYKHFFQTFANSMGLDWYQLNIASLRDIPVVGGAISQDLVNRTESFFPPDDDNDLVSINQILLENCESDNERQAVRRYLASRDDFAWSWLMTLPEFEEFQRLLESDQEEAQEFVIDRFDEDLLDQARETFENIDFFEDRKGLLFDLLMEFEEGHYRGFLAGIVLQFEGVLADLVEEVGGEIIEDGHETRFKIPRGNQKGTKNLGNLISTIFDGVFSTFLHETVRQRRNQIAHGDVIEHSRELSIHFFVSFYALCIASLNEYTRLTEQNNSEIPA